MVRFTDEYIDRLLEQADYDALVQLQAIICGWEDFNSLRPHYGLPEPIFVFVEAMTWFAQAFRSGAWTYYEATAEEHQNEMKRLLSIYGSSQYSDQYAYGLEHWQSVEQMKVLDRWMQSVDDEVTGWLLQLLKNHRTELAHVST